MISLPQDAIEKELACQILPDHIRQKVLDDQSEHDELQYKMETEVAAHNFDNTRDYRNRLHQIAISIRETIAEEEMIVTPQLIDSVLTALGYNKP